MFPHFDSLTQFLVWLASAPGALVASGFFVAYVLERFSVWHKLAHDLKSVVTIALAVGVSYLAKKYLTVDVVLGNPELNQLFNLVIYYLGNQVAYKKYFEESVG